MHWKWLGEIIRPQGMSRSQTLHGALVRCFCPGDRTESGGAPRTGLLLDDEEPRSPNIVENGGSSGNQRINTPITHSRAR